VWPLGRSTIDPLALNARVGDIDSKTIGFGWDHVFWATRCGELMKDDLRSMSPTVQFADHTEFGNVHGPDERAVVAMPDLLRGGKVDSVIVGTGA
jgi:hypothetical protein